jgi:hypothetical protein
MPHIQIKRIQLAEYDIVAIFAENLVEVGYVWWVDSGKKLFFRIHQKNIEPQSCSLFLLPIFVLQVFEILRFF